METEIRLKYKNIKLINKIDHRLNHLICATTTIHPQSSTYIIFFFIFFSKLIFSRYNRNYLAFSHIIFFFTQITFKIGRYEYILFPPPHARRTESQPRLFSVAWSRNHTHAHTKGRLNNIIGLFQMKIRSFPRADPCAGFFVCVNQAVFSSYKLYRRPRYAARF